MVFVEWDRDHWAYNDEPNQWTFESHFEIIEEGSTVSKKSSDDILRGIAGLIGEYLSDVDNDQGKTQESTAPTPDTADSPDEFIETIGNAHERATEADAFILISINEERDQAGNDIMVPYVYSSHRNDIAGVLLHAQVAAFAAAAHREAALEIIQRRRAS